MKTSKNAFASAVYNSISTVGRGIAGIYNELTGANALARNNASIGCSGYVLEAAILDFEGEAWNALSRHTGLLLGAGVAATGAILPAAAIYSAMTIVPTLYRIGKISAENAAWDAEMAELQEARNSRVPKVPRHM